MTDKPQTPATVPNVVQAISAVMASVQKVGKGGRNMQQNYSFRGIDDVLNNVGPALREHGVVVIPKLEDCAYNVVEVGKQRTLMRECTVRVRYAFYGPNGDSIECVVPGEAMDSGDKSTPKAMSVAFRVALIQALAIPTGDVEVDATSYERAPREDYDFDEQAMLTDGFLAELDKAVDDAEIQEIGGRIKAQRAKNQLSPVSYAKLAKAAAEKLAELEQVKKAEPKQPELAEAAP